MAGPSADEPWIDRYPALFRPHLHSWGGVPRDYSLQLTLQPPEDDLVVNVRLVATVGSRVVVCQTEEGWRTLPGGSRERGESVEEAAGRELMEEAGCRMIADVRWFASFTITNPAGPWRPWHPHPTTAWLVGSVAVDQVSPPTNPAEGEHVVAVQALALDDAIGYLAGFDNGGQAELVALAADLGVLEGVGRSRSRIED